MYSFVNSKQLMWCPLTTETDGLLPSRFVRHLGNWKVHLNLLPSFCQNYKVFLLLL